MLTISEEIKTSRFCRSSRYFHWKLNLYVILLVLIFVVPFYIGYFVVSNIRLCEYQSVNFKYFSQTFLNIFVFFLLHLCCLFTVHRQRLLFACMVWFTFMYFFWKLGDPFPILSPKHGEYTRSSTIYCLWRLSHLVSHLWPRLTFTRTSPVHLISCLAVKPQLR